VRGLRKGGRAVRLSHWQSWPYRKRTKAQRGVKNGCKFCLVCRSWWPVGSFYRDAAKKDGFSAYCRVCTRSHTTARRHAAKEA